MQLCEECGKGQANVHLTQISASGTVMSHLCEDCARKKGISVTVSGLEKAEETSQPSAASEPDKACAECGLTFADFREKGRLGCPECYNAFTDEIDRILTEMHGSCVHQGKRYSRVGMMRGTAADIARLRSELEQAVENEDFEEAARLRDTINALSPLE